MNRTRAWIPYLAIAMRHSIGHERWSASVTELDAALSEMAKRDASKRYASENERVSLVTLKIRSILIRHPQADPELADMLAAWHRIFARMVNDRGRETDAACRREYDQHHDAVAREVCK